MKTFRPLWFADVISTEKWLDKQAANGKKLRSFGFLGIFDFEDDIPNDMHHRIVYMKGADGHAPKGLILQGWQDVCGKKGLYAVRNPDRNAEISYEGLQTINRFVLFGLVMLLCFFGGSYLGMAAAFIGRVSDGELTVTDLPSFIFRQPVFFIGLVISLILVILFIHGGKKLPKSVVKMGGKIKTIPQENFKYTKEEEKAMLKDGRLMKKTRLGWFYDPDNIAEYIEKQAAAGWKLYRLDDMGTSFFFEKSEPTHICFVTDFQNNITEEYIENCKDDGWKFEFQSFTKILSYAVWTKEYTDTCPEFYSDEETQGIQAKRMFLATGLWLLLAAVVFLSFGLIAVVGIFSGWFFTPDDTKDIILIKGTSIYFSVICAAVTIEYLIFGISSLKYFLRHRIRK